MLNTSCPILYSFRRCPYAMRARMGLYSSGVACELREVILRSKPEHMLELSPKGTVPVLRTFDGVVIDESLDIMLWALRQNDPDGWLGPEQGSLDDMLSLIALNDGEFKDHLDRYKYPTRYDDVDPLEQRALGQEFLVVLEQRLNRSGYLFGSNASLADFAIAPFVRQFAHVDKTWFDQAPHKAVQKWLERFLESAIFISVMNKYAPWQEQDEPVIFGSQIS